MSFITSSKKVFCVESESRFEKNKFFYEKMIFATFINDFASKFAILGLKSEKIDDFQGFSWKKIAKMIFSY